MPTYLEFLGFHDKSVQYFFTAINIIIYIYLAHFQITHQPFYSKKINNYKFSVYFSIAIFSFFTFLMCLFKINTSSVLALLSPLIIIVSFIIGYKYNAYYYKKILKRIYKKFNEKQLVTDLKKTTSIDELKFSPEKFKKKNVYQSVERICMNILLFI